MLLPTDTDGNGKTHAFFKRSEDRRGVDRRPRRDRGMAAHHVRLDGSLAGLQSGVLGTLGGNAEFYAPFEANAKRWYTFCQERVPFVNHAIIHPPVDRDKPPDKVADVCVHVERRPTAA